MTDKDRPQLPPPAWYPLEDIAQRYRPQLPPPAWYSLDAVAQRWVMTEEYTLRFSMSPEMRAMLKAIGATYMVYASGDGTIEIKHLWPPERGRPSDWPSHFSKWCHALLSRRAGDRSERKTLLRASDGAAGDPEDAVRKLRRSVDAVLASMPGPFVVIDGTTQPAMVYASPLRPAPLLTHAPCGLLVRLQYVWASDGKSAQYHGKVEIQFSASDLWEAGRGAQLLERAFKSGRGVMQIDAEGVEFGKLPDWLAS